MAGSRGEAYDDYEYWRCEVGPIWIRSAPCHDSERVGYEKAGALVLVASRGRVGDWIEVVGGGYMMHDGREKRLGQLLRRLRGDEEFAAKLQQVKRDALAESMRAETQSAYDVRAEIEAATARRDSDDDDGDGGGGGDDDDDDDDETSEETSNAAAAASTSDETGPSGS